MGLYLLDYGAGNVQSLANSLRSMGHSFKWISQPSDFDDATVSPDRSLILIGYRLRHLINSLSEPHLSRRWSIRNGRPAFDQTWSPGTSSSIHIVRQALFRHMYWHAGSLCLLR